MKAHTHRTSGIAAESNDSDLWKHSELPLVPAKTPSPRSEAMFLSVKLLLFWFLPCEANLSSYITVPTNQLIANIATWWVLALCRCWRVKTIFENNCLSRLLDLMKMSCGYHKLKLSKVTIWNLFLLLEMDLPSDLQIHTHSEKIMKLLWTAFSHGGF